MSFTCLRHAYPNQPNNKRKKIESTPNITRNCKNERVKGIIIKTIQTYHTHVHYVYKFRCEIQYKMYKILYIHIYLYTDVYIPIQKLHLCSIFGYSYITYTAHSIKYTEQKLRRECVLHIYIQIRLYILRAYI